MVLDQDKDRLGTLVEEYKDVFEGLGQLPQPVDIHVKHGATPVQQPPRTPPIEFTEEIKGLERLGVIRKVDHPTEGSPIL